MGEITAASSEQSAGIDQVNAAVTSMDETTQQNAALVEQAAAAAESLVEQAIQLADVVSVFKLEGTAQFGAKSTHKTSHVSLVKPKAVVKVASKHQAKKVATKTVTDDNEWAEF